MEQSTGVNTQAECTGACGGSAPLLPGCTALTVTDIGLGHGATARYCKDKIAPQTVLLSKQTFFEVV